MLRNGMAFFDVPGRRQICSVVQFVTSHLDLTISSYSTSDLRVHRIVQSIEFRYD